MARHQVSVHTVAKAHGLFQIHGAKGIESGGLRERLGRHIDPEPVVVLLNHRHAGAVHGDRFADTDLIKPEIGSGNREPHAVAELLGFAHFADRLNNSSKH